jgi:hypothetical protein
MAHYDFVCAPSVPASNNPARRVGASPLHSQCFATSEDLQAKRGLDFSYETIRQWVVKFGPHVAQELPTPAADLTLTLNEMADCGETVLSLTRGR